MAFGYEKTGENIVGNLRMIYGTYTQGETDDGGEITHGLAQLKAFTATAATKTVACATTKKVTITTADPGENVTGYWMAMGW